MTFENRMTSIREKKAEKQLNGIDLYLVVWNFSLFIGYRPRDYYENNCCMIKQRKQDKQMKQDEKQFSEKFALRRATWGLSL